MSSRIYASNVFQQELQRLGRELRESRQYCPNCYSFRLSSVIWTASQIPTKFIQNKNKCEQCGDVCEPVTKRNLRKIKIDRLLNG